MPSTSDLDRFRDAVARLQSQLQEASRSSRFKPPTDLASALLHFDQEPNADDGTIVADILDISGGGMKVAVMVDSPVRVGQICGLQFDAGNGERFRLRGEVRWVDASAYITVFGLCLQQASCHGDD